MHELKSQQLSLCSSKRDFFFWRRRRRWDAGRLATRKEKLTWHEMRRSIARCDRKVFFWMNDYTSSCSGQRVNKCHSLSIHANYCTHGPIGRRRHRKTGMVALKRLKKKKWEIRKGKWRKCRDRKEQLKNTWKRSQAQKGIGRGVHAQSKISAKLKTNHSLVG